MPKALIKKIWERIYVRFKGTADLIASVRVWFTKLHLKYLSDKESLRYQ